MTSVNTGINTGAITIIQRAFDKRLLLLAITFWKSYRLQFLKIFLKSSGPQIALFGHFKEQWKFLDLTKHAAIDAPVSGVKSHLDKSRETLAG